MFRQPAGTQMLLRQSCPVRHEPWVAFAIVPLFALANAGVCIEGDLGAALGNGVTLGVMLGLGLGKQRGVTQRGRRSSGAGLDSEAIHSRGVTISSGLPRLVLGRP